MYTPMFRCHHFNNSFATNGLNFPCVHISENGIEDSQRGVLKLNVAIAGEFSMGSFKEK